MRIFFFDIDYLVIFTNHNNYLITNRPYIWIMKNMEITKFWKKNILSGSILSKKTGTYLSSKCVCASERSGKILVRLKKCKHFLVWLYLHTKKKSLSLQASIITSSKFIFWNNIWPLMSFILWARSCTINKW